jgi:hypothetical protein
MDEIIKFEGTSIIIIDNEVLANRSQIMKLYETNKSTLSDVINKLKEDGLVIGQHIDNEINPENRNNLNNRRLELFNLGEIIAIGLRLRSDKAISFQIWAIKKLKENLIEEMTKRKELENKFRMQQAQLDWFWDKEDQKDLYK